MFSRARLGFQLHSFNRILANTTYSRTTSTNQILASPVAAQPQLRAQPPHGPDELVVASFPDNSHVTKRRWHEAILGYIREFGKRRECSLPVYIRPPCDDPWDGNPFTRDPDDVDNVLADLLNKVELTGLRLNATTDMSYVPTSGMTSAALGELLASYYNIQSLTSQAAGALERVVIDWVRDLAGFPETSSGYITSGGTTAVMKAVLCAKHKHGINQENASSAVVYCSSLTHESVRKTMKYIGLDEAVFRTVEVTEDKRMDVGHLEQLVTSDISAGLQPFFVVGTIGTTCFGSIDPLEGIADVARTHNLWFHCDGAFGGFYLLEESVKARAKGVELADSFKTNGHKGLNLPFSSSVLIVRDGALLQSTFGLGDGATKEEEDYVPENHTFESTRPFRAFPIWFSMSLLGKSTMRENMREKVALAQYCHAQLNQLPEVVTSGLPHIATFSFRLTGKDGNDRTQNLMDSLNDDGRVFLSSTWEHGHFFIRVCINTYYCRKAHIDMMLQLIREKLNCTTIEADDSKPADRDGWVYDHHQVETMDQVQQWSREVFRQIEQELSTDGEEVATGSAVWSAIPEKGRDIEDVLKEAQQHLQDDGGECNFRRVEGRPLYANCIGNFLMNLTNTYSGHSGSNLGASQLEKILLAHFTARFGLPVTTRGWLNPSGITSTVTALIAAREHHIPDSADWTRAVLYGTEAGLETVEAGLGVVGLENCVRQVIDRTDDLKMDMAALEQQIVLDKQNGLIPFMLVGSLGSRDSGTLDPVNEQARVAHEHGVWFHLDAGIGGSYMSSDAISRKVSGTASADSVTMELEGALSQPFGLSMSLVRDGQQLARAMSLQQKAQYLLDDATSGESSYDYSFELSRPSRAVQVWCGMRLTGLTNVYYGLLVAQQRAVKIHASLCELPNIQCGPRPELPVVIFRHDAGNHATRTLRLHMEHDSDVKTDLVTIGNIDYIRVSAGWFTLKESHVTQLLQSVTKATETDVAAYTY